MEFDIAPTSANPIYRQIVEQVQRLVASGQLPPGADLPSVRAVALQHAINPMTVSKAYSLLEAQGLLERRRGLSMVVAAQHTQATPNASRVELLRPTLEKAAAEARQLELPTAQVLKLFQHILNEGEKP